MKKPTTPAAVVKKKAKHTAEEKDARKSKKAAKKTSDTPNDDRTDKKAGQKKSLKSAAKRLQKELDARMSEVVARIRKETKAKLNEVVKEATKRLDDDTERMFEQALHTIVRHYDSITTSNGPASASGETEKSADTGRKTAPKPEKPLSLNKDGSPRKTRTAVSATTTSEARQKPGRKPGAAKTTAVSISTGTRRGRPAAAKTVAAEATNSPNSPNSATAAE